MLLLVIAVDQWATGSSPLLVTTRAAQEQYGLCAFLELSLAGFFVAKRKITGTKSQQKVVS